MTSGRGLTILLLPHRKEIREWSKVMIERMKELSPLVACFNGKGILRWP